MSSNVLTAIKSISDFKINEIRKYFREYATSQVNTDRERIAYYVKDAISGSFKSAKDKKPVERYDEAFSYLGSKNKLPDMILKDGDALVIKTIKTIKGSLTISNTPPKDRLNWNDPWIAKNCRMVDGGQWNSKDIFYVTGWIERGKLKYLYFVQGRCFASEEKFYTKKIEGIKNNIYNYLASEGLKANNTVGLAKVGKMDPLGRTTLRIKNIWKIQNPIKAFSDVYTYDRKQDFTLIALMLKNKFDSFPNKDIDAIKSNNQIMSKDVRIKDPNDPAKKLDAKLITTSW
jgi:hypothetical protein